LSTVIRPVETDHESAPPARPPLQVQQHLAGGDMLPALRITLLLATLSDASCCCPGPLDSPDLVPLEELLKAQQGAGQAGLLAVVPELARMLNTSAAMLQGGHGIDCLHERARRQQRLLLLCCQSVLC
jgi:hypothetical protein